MFSRRAILPGAGHTAPVRLGLVVAVIALGASPAHADDRLLGDDTFAVTAPGAMQLDAGLVVGLPAALPTGISTGIGGGIEHVCGCHLAYGARVSYARATESSTAWTVTHGDLRVRATGSLRTDAGRGTLALRLGLGTTVVHEDRVRNQGMRAGLSGADLETTATDALPAADLEAVVALRVVGAWTMVISGGPTATWYDSHLRGGWTAELGVAWHP